MFWNTRAGTIFSFLSSSHLVWWLQIPPLFRWHPELHPQLWTFLWALNATSNDLGHLLYLCMTTELVISDSSSIPALVHPISVLKHCRETRSVNPHFPSPSRQVLSIFCVNSKIILNTNPLALSGQSTSSFPVNSLLTGFASLLNSLQPVLHTSAKGSFQSDLETLA